MNTFLRAPTLEMPNDVLDDLRNRAAADERRITAELRVPVLPNAFETMPRATRVTPYFAVNLRVPAARAPSAPAPALAPAAMAPAASPVTGGGPQASVKRAVVIALSFVVTLGVGLALAI
jgi:hypothetical protein